MSIGITADQCSISMESLNSGSDSLASRTSRISFSTRMRVSTSCWVTASTSVTRGFAVRYTARASQA